MANSSIISKLKDKVITEIVNDETFFYAINPPDIKRVEDANLMSDKYLFRYHQNPETLQITGTFLTFQVHIPRTHDRNKTWISPKLEIWIISHEKWMKVSNIPQVTASRNDYIAQLLDQKFNGRHTIGDSPIDANNLHLYGKLDLVSNIEGAYANEYLYRQLIFETIDINDSLCDDEYDE